jgi:hypothetical protein
MARDRRPTTTEQGLGWEHQQIVAQLFRDLVDGTLCDRCWRPMYHQDARNWDRRHLQGGHPHDRPRAIDRTSKATHLEHATCNESGLLLPEPETSTSREW